MMTKYYSQIILLLEFDESIKFKLKDRYDSLSDSLNVDSSSVFSKLSLLQLNFPTLTILWSRSPKETAKIFQKLKRNSGNPNLDEIMKIGKLECSKDSISSELRDLAETDVGTTERLDRKSRNKLLPQDFLRGLPGITNKNLLFHFKDIKTIKDLIDLPESEFVKILGDKFGKEAYSLLHTKVSND